jgi:hypothetical protein
MISLLKLVTKAAVFFIANLSSTLDVLQAILEKRGSNFLYFSLHKFFAQPVKRALLTVICLLYANSESVLI